MIECKRFSIAYDYNKSVIELYINNRWFIIFVYKGVYCLWLQDIIIIIIMGTMKTDIALKVYIIAWNNTIKHVKFDTNET